MRDGDLTDSDRELLLDWERLFRPAYEEVLARVREATGHEPTGRPEKRPESIIDKLRRSSTELARMQDIVGCRLIVEFPAEQQRAIDKLMLAFPGARIVDRRNRPLHGYWSVHVIPVVAGYQVEIQVRTLLQHIWALWSERIADKYGKELKWGGVPTGYEALRSALDLSGVELAQAESLETSPPYPKGWSQHQRLDYRVDQVAQAFERSATLRGQ